MVVPTAAMPWSVAEEDMVVGSIEKLFGVVDPPIAWLVFNNPERRNAVSHQMWKTLPTLIDGLARDPRVRVIVLVGAGDKAFASGADISEFEGRFQLANEGAESARPDAFFAAGASIRSCAKPTIAMIRGACVGGGLATALECDLRIADETARFAIPAAKLGIGYPFRAIQPLVALVGPAQAKAILFTGSQCGAEEALRTGLINEMVTCTKLLDRVREIAMTIARNAPLSIAASKLAIDNAVRDPVLRDMESVEAAVAAASASEDLKEGWRAFLEKRAPLFTGT